MNERKFTRRNVIWCVTGVVIGILITVALLAITAPGLMIE